MVVLTFKPAHNFHSLVVHKGDKLTCLMYRKSCKLYIAKLDTDKFRLPAFILDDMLAVHICLPPCRVCWQLQALRLLKPPASTLVQQ